MDILENGISTSSVDEIIKVSADTNSVFNDYIEQKKIGKFIFRELHARLKEIDDTKKGFPMDDNSDKIGILSQCQSLQALVSLAADFGLDFNDLQIIPGQKGSIRQIMDAVIEDVVERIQVKDENGKVVNYVFDASPYDSEHYTPEYSNIDSITWVLPSFFLILKYHASIHEVCKWEKDLIAIIKHGLKYLDEAFIDERRNKESEGLAVGWNFTKDCKEPSLYFTFAVGECYLDMYSTFRDFLTYLEAERKYKRYRIPIDAELKEAYEQKAAEYQENKNKKVHNKLEAKHDEYNELARIYRLINDIDDMDVLRIENTLYGKLESRCKDVANEVWRFVQKDLADKFFYNNLNTTLTENDIRMSTTSDALFNTVYIVNIMIDGGLHETINSERAAAVLAKDMESAEKYQREYDNMMESCQLAIQKAFRTYESLKNDSKDYIVDQFLIGFNEKFEKHKAMVNELRKLRMKTFSLLPLLIHTNNIISEFLIKYPQHSMKKYLEYILDNRYISGDREKHWIWEIDGYFSGSNYYYISALNEFFNYHDKYEKRYIAFGKKNTEREQSIREQHKKELEAPGGEISNLRIELKEREEVLADKEERINQLTKELAEFHTPVEDAVREIISQELEEKFAIMLANTFSYGAKALTIGDIDNTSDKNGVYKQINDSLWEMVTAKIFADYFSVVRKIKSAEDYADLTSKFAKDVDGTIASYITSINNSADDTSKLKKFFDKD